MVLKEGLERLCRGAAVWKCIGAAVWKGCVGRWRFGNV